MKRVILVHGWGGGPQGGWFSWIKRELENRGVIVMAPQLPNTDAPDPAKWVSALSDAVGTSDTETFFVGHSMGCQTILRFLENLPEDTVVGGAVFVAGFFDKITNLAPEERPVWERWKNMSFDPRKVVRHLHKSIAIFSDNDPYVPLSEEKNFRERIDAKTIILPKVGHFTGSDGCNELPEALSVLLGMITRGR
jgi:uncharacterized protein